jgi:hypothetical protein
MVIQEHIANRIADLFRRPQHVEVEANWKNAPGPVEHAIRVACDACRHRLHSFAESFPTAGLDDHVDMVALNRVMDDSDVVTVADGREGTFERAEESGGPEIRDTRCRLEGDVAREARSHFETGAMRNSSRMLRLPPRTRASAAPAGPRAKIEAQLRASGHAPLLPRWLEKSMATDTIS